MKAIRRVGLGIRFRWPRDGRAGSLVVLVALLLPLVIGACSAGQSVSRSASGASAALPFPAAAPPTAPGLAPVASSVNPTGVAPAPKMSPPAATDAPTADVIPLDRMVIRDAKLTLQVNNVEVALQKVRDVADANGGYVTASHTYLNKTSDQDQLVADVTIAVNSDTYDRAVQTIRGLATKVESEDGTSQDVTQEYVDLDANLRNLQASENAILKLIDKAQSIGDVLALQRELTNVRGQIERIQGRQRYLEHQTSTATISVNLHLPPVDQLGPGGTPWNPVATFVRGWRASLTALQTLADVLIVALSFGWWLIPLAGLGGYLYRRSRARSATPTASV